MIRFHEISGKKTAELPDDSKAIQSLEDAMDLLGECFGNDCTGVVIPKNILSSEFFDLKTGLAGEILQKFTTYRIKLAVTGDFSNIESRLVTLRNPVLRHYERVIR